MWRVADIETARVTLDFSSSGQRDPEVTTVSASGVQICNALEFVEVQPEATQVEVCESCGIGHCAPGGWVSFRRCGDDVVWIPAWKVMQLGAEEYEEYRPPSFLQERGAPVLSGKCWDRLRRVRSDLPGASDLPPLTSREAVRLAQHSAPMRVLGTFPDPPALQRDVLLAVVVGDLAAVADEVDRCVRRYFQATSSVRLADAGAGVAPIELLLDDPTATSWVAFGRLGDQVCLLLDGSHPLVVDAS